MEVHHPKPVHGWRQLIKEIGVIVISVLIAISAEQAVEWLHWRKVAQEAEDAMRRELIEDDLPQAVARAAAMPCLRAQLIAVTDAVEAGADRAKVNALIKAYAPMFRTWDSQAWTGAMASDALSHMGAKRMTEWAGPYTIMPAMNALATREINDYADLTGGRAKPGPMSVEEQDRVLAAVQRLRVDNTGLGAGGDILLSAAGSGGVTMPAQAKAEIIDQARRRLGACVRAPQPRDPNGQQFPEREPF